MNGSVIATHYGKYCKLLESSKNQLILDNDKIIRDARDTSNIRKAEDGGDGGDGNVGDARDNGDVVNKKAGNGNEKKDQENAEVMNNRVGISGVLENVKVDNNDMEDNFGNQENWCIIIKDGENSDDEVNYNNSVRDSARNQENWRVMVEDEENFNDGITVAVDLVVVDPIDGVLANILAYIFGSLLPRSNLLPGITATCHG